MSPFEDDGGGGGGVSTLVVNFGDVTFQGYSGLEPGEGDFLVTFNHSGSTPAPHQIDFTVKLTHASIDGTSGVHAFSVTGSPDVPGTNFFSVLIHAIPAANPIVTLGLFDGGDETPDVHDINGGVIPSDYGTPRSINLANY